MREKIIHCDNGKKFKGNFQLLIEQNNALHPNQSIKIVYTNAYTPTANGLVERMNKEFRKKIRAGFLLHNDKLWSKYMDDYAENINNQRSSTTKYTPNELWRPGYHPVVYPQGQIFNAPVINDHSSPAEINHTLQTRLYLQSKEQFKKAKQKFLVGDYVRIKLASFKLLPQIAAFAKIRDKAKIQQKYDVVNFSLARFRVDRVIPAKISAEKYDLLINHYSNADIEKMIRCRYILSMEHQHGVYEPYLIPGKNGVDFSPYFYETELVKVTQNSTAPLLQPATTARVRAFNTYDYKQTQPLHYD